MTDILAAGVPEVSFAGPLAEAERQVRAFLVTATRYLASGNQLRSLERIDADRLSSDEFDRALIRLWQNPGK